MKRILVFAAVFVVASGFVASASASFNNHTIVYDYGTDPDDYDYAVNGAYPDLPDHVYVDFSNDHLTHPTPNPDNSGAQQGFLYTYNGCNIGGRTSAPRSIASLANRDSCKKDFQGRYSHGYVGFISLHSTPLANLYSNGTAN